MDKTEKINGKYFYRGMHNLSAGELFFWVFLNEAQQQLTAHDVLTIAWKATNSYNRIAREEDKLWR